jgi:hypothetical protein
MSNNRGKNWLHFGWHPAEEDLLLFLDGEASERQASKVRAHLESCWACRTQRDKLGRAIESFMDYCEAEAADASTLPPRASLRFAERLREAASTRPKPSLIRSWAALLRWRLARRRMTVLATACLSLIAALGLILLRAERPVSAQELLRRTTQAETLSLGRVGEPVVYRRLLVKRVGSSEPVVWESWSDAQRKQFRQRVADRRGLRFLRADERETPAVIAELEQIFRANRFDPQHPLSAAAFAEWRKAIKIKAETVSEINEGLRLGTTRQEPYSINTVTEASLVVRKSDWHAIALYLNVQAENEIRAYELNETAYEVLPLQALPVFADPAPASPAASVAPKAPPAAPSLPTSPASPTAVELQNAEVSALYALHQAQADLGEQIEVLREGTGGVVAQGLVETDARKEQLTRALAGIPLVAVRIQSVEAMARQAASQAPRSSEIVPFNDSAPREAPERSAFDRRLAQYFTAQGESRKNAELKLVELSNAVLAESSAMQLEAWALRRLAERFSVGRELTPAARQRIEEMLRHHVARLKERTRALQGRLEPVLTAIIFANVEKPALAAESDWQTQAMAVFNSVEAERQLARRMFASTESVSESPEQAARQMLDAIARLNGALEVLERLIGQ